MRSSCIRKKTREILVHSTQAEIFGEFQNCKELLNAMSFLIRAQQSVNVEIEAHI